MVPYLMENSFPCLFASVLTSLLALGHRAQRNQRRFRHLRGLQRRVIAPPSSAIRVKRRLEFEELGCVDWPNKRRATGTKVLLGRKAAREPRRLRAPASSQITRERPRPHRRQTSSRSPWTCRDHLMHYKGGLRALADLVGLYIHRAVLQLVVWCQVDGYGGGA